MTAKLSFDQLLDSKASRRMKHEDRFLSRIERREDKARTMIGELVRDGATVHYVFPVGGKYKEGRFSELVSFLIRNNYA